MELRKRRKPKWGKLDNSEMKLHQQNRKSIVWESSNGSKKILMDMDTNHVRNCLNKINRENFRTNWIKIFQLELTYRQIITINKINNRSKDETRRHKERPSGLARKHSADSF